jgi:hypothetical protein
MVDMTSAEEREARERGEKAIREQGPMGYASPGLPLAAWSPALWVAITWCAMVGMLYAVGYLNPAVDEAEELKELGKRLAETQVDVAARRSAWAFSGVTLAITVVLFITCLFWAGSAMRGKARPYRIDSVLLSLGLLGLGLVGSWQVAEQLMPFTSTLGQLLLMPQTSGARSALAEQVPLGMFLLACIVPCVLVAGATLLLQPMILPRDLKLPAAAQELVRSDQLEQLTARVRELDQMLYIGALALVFGTLQLSAGMSAPLASMPKPAALKTQADLCKALAPASAASAFFVTASAASPVGRDVDRTCREIPARFVQLEAADSLRQLARGITLSFGLAFSALLAAVYVPALVGLRTMIDARATRGTDAAADDPKPHGRIAELDPLHRLAAVAATLGPVFAGLLANTLAGG